MQLQIVSYELALLAKDKGFDEALNTYYTNKGELETWNEGETYNNSTLNSPYFKENYPKVISAPSLALLVDWLRIKRNLHVSSGREMLGDIMDDDMSFYFDNEKWCYGIDDINITNEGISKMRGFKLGDSTNQYETYEKALEEGLKLALNLI